MRKLSNQMVVKIAKEGGWKKIMVEVKVLDKDGFEKAMRIFKKQCQKEGFLVEIKERRYYSKPSERKRRKRGS